MQEVLTDSDKKKEQLTNTLTLIKNKLSVLQAETDEFKEMQRIERDKKALELAIFNQKACRNTAEIKSHRIEK